MHDLKSHNLNLQSLCTVLVVKPSSLGDVVHTLPAVHLLKRSCPHLKISWLVNSEWAPLLEGNPDLDGVLSFPRREFCGIGGGMRLFRWLRTADRPRPDLALDFQGLARSALLARFAGARRLHCLGDAELVPRMLANHVVPARRDGCHSVERYLKLVADLGVPIERPLEFPLPSGNAPAGFDVGGDYLLLHPFSRGEGKSLTSASVERLCELLHPYPVVLVGRGDDLIRPVPNCLNLLNKTSIAELIWLVRHAHFTVSVDSGPMHIAAALTGRLLGIHTWSDPRLVGPCHPDNWIWKNGALMQMKTLPAEMIEGAKGFGIEDVPGVAEFLKTQL